MTTNVLKNSLSATGKAAAATGLPSAMQQMPLMAQPQYIMSGGGMPFAYPSVMAYDPMAMTTGRPDACECCMSSFGWFI